MKHYRCHKAYILKIIMEIISDTVDFFPKQFNMPENSSTDATIHAAQDLIYALHNSAPPIPLVKLVNAHKYELKSLAKIYI